MVPSTPFRWITEVLSRINLRQKVSQLDEDMRAYEQAYRIVQVLREELELGDESRVEPERI